MKSWIPIFGWLAILFGFAALFVYVVLPGQTVLIASLGAVGLLNAVFFLLTDWQNLKRSLKTRTALYGMNAFVLIAVVLGILIFVNLLSYRHKHRFDFTSSGVFTLAPQTKKIIGNLPREVTLTAFFRSDSPSRAQFQNLIDGYLNLSDKIKLNFVDPDRNPAITKQYGITTYDTVAFESGKQETKVQSPTEENLTNAFLKVIRDEKKTIYFLKGHGENDIDDPEKLGYSAAKEALMKDGFEVKPLLLLQSGAIPDDASVLIISGPDKPILEDEEKHIADYLDKGGAVLLLADPKSDFGLSGLLEKWGIGLQDDIIIDPLSKLFGGDYATPVVSQYTLHAITKDFKLETVYPVLRSVTANKQEGIETTELMQSGPNSWAETDFESKKVKFDAGVDRMGPVPIAVLASKGDKEKPEPPAGHPPVDDAEAGPPPSGPQSRFLVIGDSDFANNSFFRVAGNGDFFLNAASWLAEEENLIAIRPKERKDSPLQLTRATGSALFFLGMVVFPGMVVFAGIRNWWRRRRL